METVHTWLGGHILVLLLLFGRGAACPMFEPPNDGILTCVKTSFGKVCSPACKEGFDFVASPALFYVCESDLWSFVAMPPSDLHFPLPNCEKGGSPSRLKSFGLKSFFYGGDASTPSVQANIKENFKASLNEAYSESRFCKQNPFCTDKNIEILYNQLSVHCAAYDDPVGIADGRIANSSFTASSHYSSYPPWYARLGSTGARAGWAWYAQPWDVNEPWIQVDLGNPTLITGVATQGKRFSLWVKSYKLSFSNDGASWTVYKENDQEKVFTGNTNYYKVVTNKINVVSARFIRLLATEWNNGAALRLEVYKCKMFA